MSKLSKERNASRSDDVVITLHGKTKAGLGSISKWNPESNKAWGRRLEKARKLYSVGVYDTDHAALDEIRGTA